tara:strand:+ start:470 stop:670 length:201 start_codon:yes stop_codon:yes gene_type:complete
MSVVHGTIADGWHHTSAQQLEPALQEVSYPFSMLSSRHLFTAIANGMSMKMHSVGGHSGTNTSMSA